MNWRDDARLAKTGDAAAREQLREYLTPFAHGVLLAWAPAHLADQHVTRVLDEVLGSLAATDDAAIGALTLSVARKVGRPFAGQGELPVADPGIQAAREKLAPLRTLPDTARELFFLRIIEGIPGPELAEVARLTPSEVRHELERGATEASSRFGKTQFFGDDPYLWDLSGAPASFLAELEMQLPALRFDPMALPPPPADAGTAGTFQDLKPVSSLFAPNERTAVGDIGTEPGVVTVAPAPPPGPNPFEKQVATIAATDLPVEAQAKNPNVPWDDPSSTGTRAPSNRPLAAVSARPVPQVREGEKSGRSASGKKRQESAPRLAPPVPTREMPKSDDDEGTEAKVPALILAREGNDETAPEAVLGRPTMVLPTAVGDEPIEHQATRVAPIPAGAVPPPRPPPAFEWFQGSSPFFVAGFLVFLAVAAYGLTMFTTQRNSRANWQLTEVVVAAEDLEIGAELNLENLATRAVPQPFQGTNVVQKDRIMEAVDQRLAVAVQAGDPIFYSQFVSMREASRKLSASLVKQSRAVTVKTRARLAVGYWVKPGDSVDLVWTNSAPLHQGKVENEYIAQTVLPGIRVLATGKIAAESDELFVDQREKQYQNVTLQVPMEQAEMVVLADLEGRLTMTLRNEDDPLEADERGFKNEFTNIGTLLSGEREKVQRKRRVDVLKTVQKNAPKK